MSVCVVVHMQECACEGLGGCEHCVSMRVHECVCAHAHMHAHRCVCVCVLRRR